MDISPEERSKWLILGMLRSVDIMETAFQKLVLTDFNDDEASMKIAFIIGRKWMKTNKSQVPYEVVLSLFEHEILKNKMVTETQAEEFAVSLHWAYYQFSSNIRDVNNHIMNILGEFLIDRKVRSAAEDLHKSSNIIDTLANLNKTVAKSSISNVVFIDPFEDETPLFSDLERTPWGVDFIDIVTNGGAIPGETLLVLAPSGGGKTLTNIQLATTAAISGEDSMIITYEQGATPGITNRIYAFGLGLPVSHFQGMNPAKYLTNSTMVDKYKKLRSRIAGKLQIVDQLEAGKNNSGGSGGAEEIATIIKKSQDNGKNPRYIGVDWLGPMVNNYMSVQGIEQGEITKSMAKMADDLRKVGDNLKVNICIYHQLGTEAAASGARRKPAATDAFQCRTLHHFMDTVICIGNRDAESNIAWVSAPKVRNGEPNTDMLIQMQGSFSRWKMLDKTEVNSESMKLYEQDSAAPEVIVANPLNKREKINPVEFNAAVRANLG